MTPAPPAPPTSSPSSRSSSKMNTPICKSFVQNTWRKDLCSNCFKTKLDHCNGGTNHPADRDDSQHPETSSDQPELYTPLERFQFRKWSPTEPSNTNGRRCSDAGPPVQGILVNTEAEGEVLQRSRKSRRSSVGFLEGSPVVIGYGGDEHHGEHHDDHQREDSQDEDDDDDDGGDSDVESVENADLSQEERVFKSLTAKNTEFNADNGNLAAVVVEPHKVQLTQTTSNGLTPQQRIFRKADSRNLLRMRLQSPVSNPPDAIGSVEDNHFTENHVTDGDDESEDQDYDRDSECSRSRNSSGVSEEAEEDSSGSSDGCPPQRPPPLPRTLPPSGNCSQDDIGNSKPSCHYAASDVKQRTAPPDFSPPQPPTATVPKSTSTNSPYSSTTSPYSSTAILRGLPVRPPPATKPKPTVPAKPNLSGLPKECPLVEMAETPKVSTQPKTEHLPCPEEVNCYQQVQEDDPDEGVGVEDARRDVARMSFQSRVSNLSQSLDLSRNKSTKRQAPAPPPPPPPTYHSHQTPPSPESPTSPPTSLPGTPVKAERAKSLGYVHAEAAAGANKKKFSLKKFLRLSKDGSEDGSLVDNGTLPSRKARPEILHPMDLAKREDETAATDTAKVSEADAAIAKTLPVRPPPPPRGKVSSAEAPSKVDSIGKPARPPPPMATARTSCDPNGSDQTQHVGHSSDSESRNFMPEECGGGGKDETDDVRTRLPPRKPCRSTESESVDPVTDTETVHSSQNEYVKDPQDHKDVAVIYDTCDDDSHSDQVRSKDTGSESFMTPQSSPGSERSLGSREAIAKVSSKYQPQVAVTANPVGEDNNNVRVYEKVIIKNGSLEKVHWRLPSPNGNCNGTLSDKSVSSVSVVDSSYEEGPSSSASSSPSVWSRKKPVRLSLRKGKTIVHRNLEENYGAVVNANHQALRQILEQVTGIQKQLSPGLAEMKSSHLRWQDFTLREDCRVTTFGSKSFYSAIWKNCVEVTLMINVEMSTEPVSAKGRMFLVPVAVFEDLIPCNLLPVSSSTQEDVEDNVFFGRIWVMEPMTVETLSSFSSSPTRSPSPPSSDAEDDPIKSRCFLLLQLVHGLKQLQAIGVEEVSGDPEDFVAIVSDNSLEELPPRLVILPEDSDNRDACEGSNLTLCQCALRTLRVLLPEKPSEETCRMVIEAVAGVLRAEKAASLSRAKILLECLLWGPADLLLGAVGEATEQTFQRWLDLERATALNSLIRNPSWWHVELSLNEELMLTFLVRACAKILCEAAVILSGIQSHVTA